MLSPKNKDSFNLDISKIKLNIKEPFEFEFTGDHFKFDKNDLDNDNLHLILSRYIDNLPHIKENDIIKFYNADKTYYFKIDNVKYLTNKNYKLKIQPTDYNRKVENRVDLKGNEKLLPELIGSDTTRDYKVIVVGNTNKNCILVTDLEFKINSTEPKVDYDLIFSSDIYTKEQFKDLIKIFNEDDVIELIPSDNKKTDNLINKNQFLINKIDEETNTLKLNSSETIATIDMDKKKILEGKEFLIKKVGLNDIVEKYHNDQKTHYTEHLRIKNEAKNLGIMVDRIKEQMNRI